MCTVLMVQGHLVDVTLAHLAIASKTGLLAVVPILGISFSPYARHLVNRWMGSAVFGVCTFVADAMMHSSHYPGAYTEAALTGLGGAVFSLGVSYTPVRSHIERLAEGLLDAHR